MGKPTTGADDASTNFVTGAFAAAGNGTALLVRPGTLNCSLWGTFVGTAILERSFDGGTTYLPVSIDLTGAGNSYTAPMTLTCAETEPGALYRFRCPTFTSGPINYRISQ